MYPLVSMTNWHLLSLSIIIATISVTLQYLSHRYTVLDTEHEREQKIKESIPSEGTHIPEFADTDKQVKVRLHTVVVSEYESKQYVLQKYLYPFSNINGRTKAILEVESLKPLPVGVFAINGWSQESTVLQACFLHRPPAAPIVAIHIDSVRLNDVKSAFGGISKDGLQLSDEPDDIVDVIAHFPSVLDDLDIDVEPDDLERSKR